MTASDLSNDLANAVERAGRSVLAVNGRERTPSSGVHWRKGVVVTTDHTLKQEEDITVTSGNGQTMAATIAGRDPGSDLAVLRVAELDMPEAEIGDSAGLRVGHLVLAVGRGLSASLGVVSSLSGPWRTWRGGLLDQFIRLDASIYTGFSGGALVDAQGRIIGVNTSGLSRGGALTVPVSTVNRVTDEILAKGRVARGYLGIGMQPVRLGNGAAGLIIVSVEPNAPASNAGVLLGDILTAVEGKAIEDLDDLQAVLTPDRIGRPVAVELIRGGAQTRLNITVGERP